MELNPRSYKSIKEYMKKEGINNRGVLARKIVDIYRQPARDRRRAERERQEELVKES